MKQIKPTTALKRMKKLLTPDTWCKQALAKTLDNMWVAPRAKDAVKFCLLGACERSLPEKPESWFIQKQVENALRLAIASKGYNDYGIGEFNDAQETVEPVLEVIDIAIKIAEKHD